jgi:hypothetical protein
MDEDLSRSLTTPVLILNMPSEPKLDICIWDAETHDGSSDSDTSLELEETGDILPCTVKQEQVEGSQNEQEPMSR